MVGRKHEYVSPRELAGKAEGFCLGVEFGKAVVGLDARLKHATVTMAEVDAHYEGLLAEIREMREQLKAADRGQIGGIDGQESREAVDEGV